MADAILCENSLWVSEDHFDNSLLLMILGLLQGSAAVGAIWALNSSLLFQILDTAFTPA
jgi:hypothetical protein